MLRWRRSALASFGAVVCVLFCERCSAEQVFVAPRWSNVFEGSRVDFDFQAVRVEPGSAARWRLATADSLDRTLASGTARVERAGSSGAIAFAVDIPALRTQAPVEVVLRVVAPSNGQDVAIERPLVIYARNPLASVTHGLREHGPALFDPDAVLDPKLKELGLDTRLLSRVDDLARVERGTVVVAEGVSFREFRGLGEALLEAAERGVRVVCLAPVDLRLPLPAADAIRGASPRRMALESVDIIGRWDKRYDTVWYPGVDPIIASVQLAGDRTGIEIESLGDAAGYPWLDLEYASKGRFIVCGFGIARHWETSPTPRYLLASILIHLAALERSTPVADRDSIGGVGTTAK